MTIVDILNSIIARDAEPGPWLSQDVIDERRREFERERQETQARQEHTRQLSPFEVNCNRVLELIALGDEVASGALAKHVATETYDQQLDRCLCEETGNVYFHACDYDY